MIGAGDMGAPEVHAGLDALAAAGCRAWIGGGWGVDALVGYQTRGHRDLDLAVNADHGAAVLVALGKLGYVIETDWRPVRVEVVAAGRGRVDIHPVTFDEAGDGRQADRLQGATPPLSSAQRASQAGARPPRTRPRLFPVYRVRNQRFVLAASSSRPCAWAGGDVASTAVKRSRILYECLAPRGTTHELPGSSSTVCPSTRSSARPLMT